MSAPAGQRRLQYADVLRILSIFAVVVLHISAGWMDRTAVTTGDWAVLNFYNSLVRWCVPLFVMLSGMFLLDPNKRVTARSLLRHGLRLAGALVSWSVLYVLWGEVLREGPFSLHAVVYGLKEVLWGSLHYHLWFLPMMLGLYLVTPVLRAFVRGAEEKDFRWFFLLALIFSCLLPTLQGLRPSATLSEWTRRLDVRAVMGYVGFYVAGYYLRTRTLSPLVRRTLCLLGLLGAGVTMAGTAYLSRSAGKAVLTLYSYFAPNVVLMALAVFVFFKELPALRSDTERRWISRLAPAVFGVYLCHDAFVMLLKHTGVSTLSFSPVLSVPLLSLGVFLASAAVSLLLSRLPFAGRVLT